MDDVHLQRFDLKVPVIATIWAGQRHERFPFPHQTEPDAKVRATLGLYKVSILCNGWALAQPKIGRKSLIRNNFEEIFTPSVEQRRPR